MPQARNVNAWVNALPKMKPRTAHHYLPSESTAGHCWRSPLNHHPAGVVCTPDANIQRPSMRQRGYLLVIPKIVLIDLTRPVVLSNGLRYLLGCKISAGQIQQSKSKSLNNPAFTNILGSMTTMASSFNS